jgi:hypothetical protein
MRANSLITTGQMAKSKAYAPDLPGQRKAAASRPDTTAEAEAAKSKEPGAAPKAFDHANAKESMTTLRQRVDKFPRIAKSDFYAQMEAYVGAAGSDNPAVAEGAGELLEAALKTLVSLDAFRIPAHKYATATETAEGTENAIAEATESSMLWSKLTHYRAIDDVEDGARGNSLEASAAGSLFNGLGFGMDYGTHMVLQKQWKEVSQNYVSNVRGVVHAYLFEGVHPDSVFTKTEWPIIAKLMRNHGRGQTIVTELVAHIFELDASGKELQEVGTQSIWHPDQWLELPSARDLDDVDDETGKAYGPTTMPDGTVKKGTTTWKDRQNAAYQAETDRHNNTTTESRNAEREKAAQAKAAARERANQMKARFVPADDD